MNHDDSNSHRATQIFRFEEDCLSSPITGKIWRTRSEPFESFKSVSVTHWEIVVTRHKDRCR